VRQQQIHAERQHDRDDAGDHPARAAMQPHHHDKRGVHPNHDEIAMAEIDHVHHTPDQREPRREQRVNRADEKPADDDLNESEGHFNGRHPRA
jgi:hypothetical protein